MKNILILNGGKVFGHSNGELNHSLSSIAAEFLQQHHAVKTTEIDSGYEIEQEIDKWLWADLVIYQMPAWWMGPPWIVKKYMDEVFTAGHGKLYASDGRSREDSSKKYGSGGILQGKHYLFSVTWNAPEEAFSDPSQFFSGLGVESVYLPVHKAHQFLGMTPLPSFICNDVIKNPSISADIERYKQHLTKAVESI